MGPDELQGTEWPQACANVSEEDLQALLAEVGGPAAETAPSVLSFGETASWDDGLEVTIAVPEAFTPSETALEFMAAEHLHYVKLGIRVVNGTTVPYDASQFLISAQSSNQEAEVVFDTESGLDGGPMTAVLPGREAEFFYGFGVSDPADLVVEVAPGYEWDPVFFQS